MKKARGITMVTLLAVLSVAGVNGAAAQNNCPYDATGDYSYDPGRTPDYLFGGDGQITYDGTLAWYMDDIGACYNVYKDGRYLMYFPKCDIDGDGKVGIGEVYDIYYRVQPVGQGNSIAQQACIEAFAGGSFFFCPPSRYNRTVVDIQAIIGEYPATAAISDMATSGPGHLPEEHLVDALTCTTPGVFPAGLFDTLHECYLAVESRSATSNQVDVDFSNALDISNAVQEYSNLAQQFGGICAPVASGATQGDAPGFHYSKHDDQGWWFWSVRALEQCDGESCACDITYELFTHKDYPGQVAFQAETANNNGCTDLRFIDCDTTIDADSDGTPDCIDQCDYDPAKTEPGLCGCGFSDADVDQDGQPDVCGDECPSDPNKVTPGTCGCGVPDVDSDGDGLYDCVDECPHDPYPSPCGCNTNLYSGGLCCHEYLDIPCWCLDGTGDSDGDGVIECAESCPGDPNKIDPGVCGCGVPDTDTDGDGVLDCEEQCDNDPNKTVPGVCGCGTEDRDSDGDAVYDCNDGCPWDPNKTEPGICGCGWYDVDSDDDGVLDCIDPCPNSPYPPGICGCDVPDTDSDGDGTPDCQDQCDNDPAKIVPGVCGCGVPDIDSDGDGVMDCIDPCPYNNPDDPDGDGVCGDSSVSEEELCVFTGGEWQYQCYHWPCGYTPDCDSTDPGCNCGYNANFVAGQGCVYDPTCGACIHDSDGDAVLDCDDNCPFDPAKIDPGSCGCGIVEQAGCTGSPCGACGCGVAETDSDGDGWLDCEETCDQDPNKTDPGVCGCGTADIDQNGNGIIDCLETEGPCIDLGPDFADCDGPISGVAVSAGSCVEVCAQSLVEFATIAECEATCFGGCDESIDTDADGTPDCYDLCPNDPVKVDPGVCGCGVADTDTDGDGLYDCMEICVDDPNKADPGVCGCGIPEGTCQPPQGCPADVPLFYDQRSSEISETAGGACVEHAGVDGPPACAQEQHATFQEDIENFLATYAFTGAVFDHTTGGGQSWQESPFTLLCMDFPDGELPYNLFDDLNACYNATPEWGTGIRYARIEFNWAVNIWELQPIYEARAATVGAFCDFDTMVSVDGNPTPMGFHVRDDGDPWRYWTVRSTDTCDYYGCRCDATVSGWTDGSGTIWEDQVVNNSFFVDYEGQHCSDPRFDF